MSYTIGTATFTNGNPVATSVTYSQGGSAYIANGTSLVVGANPVMAQVSAAGVSSNTLTLSNDWDYPTGTYQFVATFTTESLRNAVESARTFADLLDAARTDFDDTIASLGTAANADIVTSNSDSASGRVLTVGYGGLGGASIPSSEYGNDLANIYTNESYNGFVLGVSTSTLNRPDIAPSNVSGYLIKMKERFSFFPIFPTSENETVYYGFYNGSDISWSKNYSSSNANFNEFGSVITNDIIATGYVVLTTDIQFYIPINSYTQPSSITQEGVISVTNFLGSEVSNDGSPITLSPRSSNKVMVLQVGGFSGLTVGSQYHLRTKTSGAKITVNF